MVSSPCLTFRPGSPLTIEEGLRPEEAGVLGGGALLFTISDATLAWDAFLQPHTHLVVMTTSYTAKVLITLSAVEGGRLMTD